MDSDKRQKIMLLGAKKGAIRVKDLGLELGMEEEATLGFLRESFPSETGARVYFEKNEYWVELDLEEIRFSVPLSAPEYVQLYEIVSKMAPSLKKRFFSDPQVKSMMGLLEELEFKQSVSDGQVSLIEEAITNKSVLQITGPEGKVFSVLPCKVLHLEGQLSLVAEDLFEHCLQVVILKDLCGLEVFDSEKQLRSSAFEVEEFINAIRSMGDRETRLILKIHHPLEVNLFPEYHFLGKPCMITNPNGDLIWAAYVEPCAALFEWLISLSSHVEILDPISFKQEYLSYCEEKVRKIA